MFSIKSDFVEKREEADLLLTHISELTAASGNINTVAILKSSFMILLYNMVESTTVLVLDRVHERASRHSYRDLSDKLRKLFVEYYLFKENQSKQIKQLNSIVDDALLFPEFDEFTRKVNLFSGNLDARELNNLLSRYGIGKVTSKNKEDLLTVKNNRNKIAHGELMLKECCRNSTITELEKIKMAVFDALDQIINLTETYFAQQRYLRN